MFYLLIITMYYHQHLLLHLTSASSLLYTLNDLRYSLSDRILNIPKLGALRGITIDYETNYSDKYHLVNIEAYLGIQYGIYYGRFEPSKEKYHVNFNSKVTKQIEYGPACSQLIWKNESELIRIRDESFARDYYPKLLKFITHQNEQECLYMNIYQPQMKNNKERLPVLLYVHGDGYDMSTGAAFDGSIFASYTKTIVVTINYRLGVFGFLYVSKENKGNYALHDIYTALHWLKNNIMHFNGDPDRITLYGTDSGAVLASLVVMLETVNGGTGTVKRRKSLVHRLILNDQTFLSPHMTSKFEDISSYQSMILSKLSCSTSSCLRNQTLILTDDFLQLNSYSIEKNVRNYICPLEQPFPFTNFLRTKFSSQAEIYLPENLPILLTTSSNILRRKRLFPFECKQLPSNNILEYLFNYAYTKWNQTMNQFSFDEQTFVYHQEYLASLLEYAKYVSNQRHVHIFERSSNKYQSELPLTFGYVLAPSMSVFNESYLNADESDRNESMLIMDLFANLIHNGDINKPSPYYRRKQDESKEKYHPVYPTMNFIVLEDGNLTQKSGYHTAVHYLFNNLVSNLSNQPFNIDLLNTWRSLYEVSHRTNTSTIRSFILSSSIRTKLVQSDIKNLKYIFLLTLSIFLIIIINFFLCILLTKRGFFHRKREYNCLNGHTQITIEKPSIHQARAGSSPSSTNSNGTITQQLIVQTNCTTTNSSVSSTPPVDILHPVNVTKKNDIFRSSSLKKTSYLPEAIV